MKQKQNIVHKHEFFHQWLMKMSKNQKLPRVLDTEVFFKTILPSLQLFHFELIDLGVFVCTDLNLNNNNAVL